MLSNRELIGLGVAGLFVLYDIYVGKPENGIENIVQFVLTFVLERHLKI